MKYLQLGQHSLSKIGLGTMGFGGRFSADRSDDVRFTRAIEHHMEQGVNFIDTAEVYSAGYSEELIGRAVKGKRSRVFIASKVSPQNLAPDNLIASAEASLQRLGTDYLDLYQIHWPNSAIAIEDTMEAMSRLLQEGKIRHIGLSNFSVSEMQMAQSVCHSKVTFCQSEYNLFDRSAEQELIPYCQQNDMVFLAYSPLDQGKVVWNEELRERLAIYAEKFGVKPSQLALRFLTRFENVIAIPKAVSETNINDNVTAFDFELSTKELQELSDKLNNTVTFIKGSTVKPAAELTPENGYMTIQDALANDRRMVPSPKEMAEEILADCNIKPIRVSALPKRENKFEYLLEEGKMRYWAWMIAFGDQKPLPVLVRS